ncbi:tyrosine-type recombinase/integrase [Lacrimispora saccharolytica]|uniref:Integrase family protein n=1 Tax=Lacrimispora saccharolytica (strain ATCC 35040 / DSM 2544 / NRCC 2533 / WM1) TaxID=610130 RepID=D9R8N1_LACSW|nr:tyrosine-type recombinase/integrase [Lacrimispora saccharolytica]ADL05760.1 integrase family protein [[Clostridium] saccharolyticum WM1]QRV20099.1 tyrosine-type recombinase/integrase [Lacrimispora saccharolytica]
MSQAKKKRDITPELIKRFSVYLREQEKSTSTIEKYKRDLAVLCNFLGDVPITKSALIDWKEYLTRNYAAASVNTMLAAVNAFLNFAGWIDLKVKPLKIQRNLFCREEKELTRKEYLRLVQAAEREGNQRLSLVIQSICATGIRVSELQFITMEAVQAGRADVNCKGKTRTIFLPEKLRRALISYARRQKRSFGPVFVTKTGKPLDRSNIWRDMKDLCKSADVKPEKVFPHNLRHLFARIYYTLEKDLFRLADILGHSNINTTRIYTVESGTVHAQQIEHMRLVIT